MNKTTSLLLAAALLCLCHGVHVEASSRIDKADPSTWPIKNVVVLMLENRAFDHMLGYVSCRTVTDI